MTKRLTISLSNWVHDTYLIGVKNKSKFIEEMLIKGVDVTIGETQGVKARQIELLKELRSLTEKNKQLSLENGSLKHKVSAKEEKERKIREKAFQETIARKAQSDLHEVLDSD